MGYTIPFSLPYPTKPAYWPAWLGTLQHGGKEDASSTQDKSTATLHHLQNNWSADEEHQCWSGCAGNKLPLKDHSEKINAVFPKLFIFFFIEEKFRSCISSSFFCQKRGKVYKYQHTPNGEILHCPAKTSFFYSWPDITLCSHELLHCPEPLFFFMGPANGP